MKHTHKKWIKKSTALFTATILGLSSAPVSVWATEDYQQQAKDSLSNFAKDLASDYETSMSALNAADDSLGAKLNMSLSIDPSLTPMLSGLTGMDMSWLSSISLIADETFTTNAMGIKYDIQLNNTEICPFNLYMDTTSGNSYISAPTLFDGYLFMNTAETLENSGATEEIPAESLPALTEAFSIAQYKEKLPKPSDVEDLINRYGSILINSADDSEEAADESIYTHDVEQNCTRYTGYYSPAAIYNISEELTTTVKEDTQLKEILDNYNSLFPTEENFYDLLLESLEEVSAGEAPVDEDGFLAFSLWKDENGNTTGTEVSIFAGDNTSPVSFTYQAPRQDDKRGLSISISDDTDSFIFAGSGSITDGKLNGSYTASMNETPMVQIEVEGYDTEAADSGSVIGKYTFRLLDGAISDESTAAMLSGLTFVLDVNAGMETQDYSLSLVSQDITLATLALNIATSSDMEIPDFSTLENVYDMNDEVAMNGLEATLNLEAVFNNLITAGMPEELLTALLMGDAAAEAPAEVPEAEQAPVDAA